MSAPVRGLNGRAICFAARVVDSRLMKTLPKCLWLLAGWLPGLCAPAFATVQILSITPSLKSPQPIGAVVRWVVRATDSHAGTPTFQFNLAPPGGALALVKDFNVGTFQSGAWTSQPFVWVPTGIEGVYQIQVVIKDFASGETASKTVQFQVSPLVTGSTPVVVATANPLVALFSAPSCPAGSTMQVAFQPQSLKAPQTTTSSISCHPPATMTFEIAGMYPGTTYNMVAQTNTGGVVTNGAPATFTTGALPIDIPFPSYTVNIAATSQTDTADWVILQNVLQFGGNVVYPEVATDLSGNIIWYYNTGQRMFLTRPLQNGTMLTMQNGLSWNPASTGLQLLRQIDLAGNIVKETNLGVLSEQLVAMGAADAALCNTIPIPTPVGAACIDAFHHDAIQTLPNGDTAVLVAVEKIFPPGTQGDTTGLPVDIVGDMIVVLDINWQVLWYFDTFQHDSGAPQLDITRPAVLGETCTAGQSADCPIISLVTPGISPLAKDWLHANSLYYWPQSGDIVWSSRNQDWIMKVDYNNGAGTGNILWRMGPCGDFMFNDLNNDAWPWFSHQHEPGMENGGAGPLTLLDNGNTRYSKPGASTGCIQGVGAGDSRGMALTVDESNMTVTPVLSVNLEVRSFGDGSAQLLSGGNYSFLPSYVRLPGTRDIVSYPIEILPTPGTLTGTQVLNILAPQNYRIWRMPSLYAPPIT